MKTSILGLALACFIACGASETALKGSAFSANLEECNRTAADLCQSIACENRYRAAAGHFPRDVPKHCIKVESTIVINKGFDNDGGQWADAAVDSGKDSAP